ncbi:glycosyltransferase family 39 protein [Spirosoma sp. KNUC1025]|uniref:glycosyltransferase family 39 protein n=1 Tax=Spirosoma sp. KNUC1025 TaxID=2894082 RepID=UPI0038682BDA|nr:glycosyltransferase family 39 protein [Spirosoma sp. KNUC1025]
MSVFLHSLYQYIAQRTYSLIWFVAGILGLVTIYIRLKTIFLVNPDIGGIESNIVYSVLRMLSGYPLYDNPEIAPYAITQYSPIYYYLTVGVAQLSGLTPDDVYYVYIVGRCISLVFNGIYAWGIYQLARKVASPTSISVLVSLVAFCLLPPQSYARPDSQYNAFVVWTLLAVIRWMNSDRNKSLLFSTILVALLAAIALFCKQSAICLPIIIGGYLVLFSRRPWQIFPF